MEQFVFNIAAVHNNNNTVFAATQSFVIADGGHDLVVGLLAVLREGLDAQDPTSPNAAPASLKTDLIVDFTLMEPSGNVTTSTTWLDIQLLGSHFQTERQKRAAWSLGQLNSSSHPQPDTNFLWIRQDYRNSLDLRSGRFCSPFERSSNADIATSSGLDAADIWILYPLLPQQRHCQS